MAVNSQLLAFIQHVEAERGVNREVVITAIESAMKQAARNNRMVTSDLRVVVDRKDYQLHVYDKLVATDQSVGTGFISLAKARRIIKDHEVADGETIEVELPAAFLGRIAAQNSRQLIMQKLREIERANTIHEYADREGDIVSGTVSAISRRDIYVTVGKTEMIIPDRERIPSEDYQVGDPIRAVILHVDEKAKGPAVILSRAANEYLEALFRLEVSEIADGVVQICSVARDPGYRAKIAVMTANENVDPVGACVGQRGSRVKAIVSELSGEKIDIVRYNEDICQYAAAALAPAKLETLSYDKKLNTVFVTVPTDQYSLAIGKRGQNVRLSSELVGVRIDVKKSLATASYEEQKAAAIRELSDMFSVSAAEATVMVEHGFLSVASILYETQEDFVNCVGLDEITAIGVYAAAQAVAARTQGDKADEA